MPGSEAMTVDGTNAALDSLSTADKPSIGDSELRNEWKKLLLRMKERAYETDVDNRHDGSTLNRALELALSHPDDVSVSTKPVERNTDMRNHIADHFDDLLNEEDNATELRYPRPDVKRLLRACELAYLYDAVYRFMTETVVTPDIDGLADLRFVELPDSLHRWMGEVDVLWMVLVRDMAPEERVEEMIDRLYEDRDAFVETAIDLDLFMPVRGDYLDEPDRTRENVDKRLVRGAEVSTKDVHDYCFTRTVDRY